MTGGVFMTTSGTTGDDPLIPACEKACKDCPKDGQSLDECVQGCLDTPSDKCQEYWIEYINCLPTASCDPGQGCSAWGSAFGMCMSEPACADCFLDAGETCDDGNMVSDDGCSATCQLESVCGNGKLQYGELCDDGNQMNGDGCNSNCSVATCGDGEVQPPELCDEGPNNGLGPCLEACVPRGEACGQMMQVLQEGGSFGWRAALCQRAEGASSFGKVCGL